MLALSLPRGQTCRAGSVPVPGDKPSGLAASLSQGTNLQGWHCPCHQGTTPLCWQCPCSGDNPAVLAPSLSPGTPLSPDLDMAQVGRWLWAPLRTRSQGCPLAVPKVRLMRTCPLARGCCSSPSTPNSCPQPVPTLLPHPRSSGAARWLGHERVKAPGAGLWGKRSVSSLPVHIWMQ